MQISKKMKQNLNLVLFTVLVILVVYLILQNTVLAPYENQTGQFQMYQPYQTDTQAATADQTGEAQREPVQETVAAPTVPAAAAEPEPEIIEVDGGEVQETRSGPPVGFIIVAAGLACLVLAGVVILIVKVIIPYIQSRKGGESGEDEEDAGEDLSEEADGYYDPDVNFDVDPEEELYFESDNEAYDTDGEEDGTEEPPEEREDTSDQEDEEYPLVGYNDGDEEVVA